MRASHQCGWDVVLTCNVTISLRKSNRSLRKMSSARRPCEGAISSSHVCLSFCTTTFEVVIVELTTASDNPIVWSAKHHA